MARDSVEVAQARRCSWCGGDEAYVAYHDDEWGVPVYEPQELFERLILEGMQAGLSWLTILRKRTHMQARFFGFDIARLAASGEAELQSWLDDAGLIRHRGKLQAMQINARLTLEQQDFSGWLWSFAPDAAGSYHQEQEVPAQTDESVAMSKALKKAGYRFVGPTICYAFMQSVGMVNDHVRDCWRFEPCEHLRRQSTL